MRTLAFVALTFGFGCGDDAAAPDAAVDGGRDAAAADATLGRDAAAGLDAAPPDASPALDASSDAGGDDTWESYAADWMRRFCVECHAGGRRDYTTPADVMRDAARIRCGVSPDRPLDGCGASPRARQFPIGDGPFPTDDERRRLVAWIDAGMP